MDRKDTSRKARSADSAGERKARPCGCGTPEGSAMEEMIDACPCKTFIERHRVAFYTALTGIGLVMIAVPVGWILGVIAFFRTLG